MKRAPQRLEKGLHGGATSGQMREVTGVGEFCPIGERFSDGSCRGGGACADPVRHLGLPGDIESGAKAGEVFCHGTGNKSDALANFHIGHSAEYSENVGAGNGEGIGDAGGNPYCAEFGDGRGKFPLPAGRANIGVCYKVDSAVGVSAVRLLAFLKRGQDFSHRVPVLTGESERHAWEWHVSSHPGVLDIERLGWESRKLRIIRSGEEG